MSQIFVFLIFRLKKSIAFQQLLYIFLIKLIKLNFWPAATEALPVRPCPMLSKTVKERRYGVSDWG